MFMQAITVKPNVPFPLEREVCVEATVAVRLYLPAEILVAGERIADVISVSDDEIEIGLRESGRTGKLSALVAFLKPGDRITLHRSAEVMIENDDGSDVTFHLK